MSSIPRGLICKLKAQICDNMALYADKYQEEYQIVVLPCVRAVWELLVSLNQSEENDNLVSSGMHFLSSASQTKWDFGSHLDKNSDNRSKNPFADPIILQQICEKVVIPNIHLRDVDVELLEDNPQEWIRRDIEGADQNTRRSAALNLVKALGKFYDQQVTAVLLQFVQTLIAQSVEAISGGNVGLGERLKDSAVYVMIAVAVRGTTTRQKGLSTVNELVDVSQFFNQHLLSELKAEPMQQRYIIRASSMKYITIFRNQIPQETLEGILPMVCKHLLSENAVVHTYAANCIERLLITRTPGGPKLDVRNVKTILLQAMEPLLQIILTNRGVRENEYMVKCVMRIFIFMKEEASPIALGTFKQLVEVVKVVSANPSNPVFNHYLFEAVATLVKIMATTPQAKEVEDLLVPVLLVIIQHGMHDFVPYAFQILGLLLDSTSASSDLYTQLFNHLMEDSCWHASNANVPGVIRLLAAYFRKHSLFSVLLTTNMQGLLGRFQFCLFHKKLSVSSFELLNNILRYLPSSFYEQYMQMLITVLLTRLQAHKTEKLSRDVAVSLSLFTCKEEHSEASLPRLLTNIQEGLVEKFFLQVFLPAVKTITSIYHKKVCVLGLAKLCASPIYGNHSEVLRVSLAIIAELFGGVQAADANRTSKEKVEEEAAEFEAMMAFVGADGAAVVTDDFDITYARLGAAEVVSKDLIDGIVDVPGNVRDLLFSVRSVVEEAARMDPSIVRLLTLLNNQQR